jgi:hypothetical protein
MTKGLVVFAGFWVLSLLASCGGNGDPHIQHLAITSAAPPSGATGSLYGGSGGFALTASGGVGRYQWTSSALPDGLYIATGPYSAISGMPTVAGTYNVVITVTDSQFPPAQISASYSIKIDNVFTIVSGLPNGVAGYLYTNRSDKCWDGHQYVYCDGVTLRAVGGVGDYHWSWAGAPGSYTPPGLHVTGNPSSCHNPFTVPQTGWQICGRPTTAGAYTVVLTATDSASPPNQASVTSTINITNPPPPTIKTTAASVGAINLPYSFQFTANDGLAPLTWRQTGVLPQGLTLATDGTLSGTPTALGSSLITVTVTDSLSRSSPPQDFTILIAAHGFRATSSMAYKRDGHTATLLQDGRVLVTGGWQQFQSAPSPTAELYDPAANTFSATGYMGTSRGCHTATLLANGKVLIAGGESGPAVVATAEIFDPASGTFAPTGNMSSARCAHTATLLNDGRVLIAGGHDGTAALATAELYDPAAGTFSSAGSMSTARDGHTATLLQNGSVLLAGGDTAIGQGDGTETDTAELYDPIAGKFSSTNHMMSPRVGHTATLLGNGQVLVTGGASGTPLGGGTLTTAELYDAATASFVSTGSMADARLGHTATLLGNGMVLVAGGQSTSILSSAELFDPAVGSFTVTGSLTAPRDGHRATLLSDGTVLVTGGNSDNTISGPKFLATAEVFQ